MYLRLLLLTLFLSLGITGCGSGSDDGSSISDAPSTGGDGDGDSSSASSCQPADSDGVISCQIDARSYEDFVYFSFADADTVDLSTTDARSSDAWDIALRRYAVMTNGGSSTNNVGQAAAAMVDAQADFYDSDGNPIASVFTNATAAAERDHLLNATTLPADWTADQEVSALAPQAVNDDSNCSATVSPPAYRINYGWYTYHGGCLPTPHTLSANDDTGWLLRSGSSDSYARFRATDMSFSNSSGLTASFEFLVQLTGTSSYTENRQWQVNNLADGEQCYDFDAGTVATDCSGNSWDIKVIVDGQDIMLRSNSGPSGAGDAGAFGPLPWTDISSYDNGTVGPAGEPLASLYQADANSSVIDSESWHAYNLTGTHKLWPNYRVFMINIDTSDAAAVIYALQIISYYDDTGESGHISLRFKPVARP